MFSDVIALVQGCAQNMERTKLYSLILKRKLALSFLRTSNCCCHVGKAVRKHISAFSECSYFSGTASNQYTLSKVFITTSNITGSTQLSIPTHAYFHWLKFIKTSKKLLHVSVYDHHKGDKVSLLKLLLFKPQLYVY